MIWLLIIAQLITKHNQMKNLSNSDEWINPELIENLLSKLRALTGKKKLIPVPVKNYISTFALLFISILSIAQTTYYSRNGATAPRNWNEADSWTLNSDGTGAAASVPGRNDNVIILNGHNIIVAATNANGSAGESPESIGVIDVAGGDEIFPSSASTMFYQTGNITVNPGATLTLNVSAILEGTTISEGTITSSGDIVNLGRLEANAGSSLSIGDDFILAGNSETEINISSVGADDIYFDHTSALLCGTGDLNLTGGGSAIQTYNGGDESLQVCSDFTINGCPTCPFSGSGSFTLPIDLISFKVTEHQLYWDVYQYEVYAFQIEFSMDAISWESIGQVDSKGDGRKQYYFPVRETGYYRIKSLEEYPDYSWPVFYRSNEHKLTMYPSRIESGNPLTVQGFDINYVTVSNSSGILQKEISNNFENIILDMKPGMYIVRVHEGVGVSTHKVMVY